MLTHSWNPVNFLKFSSSYHHFLCMKYREMYGIHRVFHLKISHTGPKTILDKDTWKAADPRAWQPSLLLPQSKQSSRVKRPHQMSWRARQPRVRLQTNLPSAFHFPITFSELLFFVQHGTSVPGSTYIFWSSFTYRVPHAVVIICMLLF